MTGIPWAVFISLIVLAFAYLIKHFLSHIFEEGPEFLVVIGIFLLIYVGAAFAITTLNPQISQNEAYPASNG